MKKYLTNEEKFEIWDSLDSKAYEIAEYLAGNYGFSVNCSNVLKVNIDKEKMFVECDDFDDDHGVFYFNTSLLFDDNWKEECDQLIKNEIFLAEERAKKEKSNLEFKRSIEKAWNRKNGLKSNIQCREINENKWFYLKTFNYFNWSRYDFRIEPDDSVREKIIAKELKDERKRYEELKLKFKE